MERAVFWGLIGRIDVTDSSDDAAVAALSSVLADLGEDRISEFETHFRREMASLDTAALRLTANELWVLTSEKWLHLRAWCISRGRDFVRRLHAHPATLRVLGATHTNPFETPSGELLLYCMDYARGPRAVGAQ